MIEAHGATYQTVAEANARIAELNELNLQLGASDGRVTEIQCIIEALQEGGFEQDPKRARLEQAIQNSRARYAAPSPMDSHTAGQVHEAERRIAYLEQNKTADDGQWRYLKFQDANERVTRREYKTELGFLKGYVKAARDGMDILIAE
jgi:hypothetical protein